MVLNKKSVVSKVDYLLSIAKQETYTPKDLDEIVSMIDEHTDHMVLGRVFGYSVSDYAYAVLKWLNTEESLELFDNLYKKLDISPSGKARQNEINKLIQTKIYLEY